MQESVSLPEIRQTNRLRAALGQIYNSGALLIAGVMVSAETIDRGAFVVRADNPVPLEAERAIPSAFITPEGDYSRALGVSAQVGLTALGVGLARKTSSLPEVAGVSLTAQLVGCAADAAVERTNLLTHAEKAQEDVGSSSIYVALIGKYLLDKHAEAENKLPWRVGIGAFVTGAVVLIPLAEGSGGGGKLDVVSHTASLVVAYGAHKFSEFKKSRRPNHESAK